MTPEGPLSRQYACAHAFVVGSEIVVHSVSTSQWRRLKALDLQVSNGPCDYAPPPAWEVEERSLWREWRNLGSMSRSEAQETFVGQVLQLCEAMDHEPAVIDFLREFALLNKTPQEAGGNQLATLHSSVQPLTRSVSNTPMATLSVSAGSLQGDVRSSTSSAATALDLKTALSSLAEEVQVLSANAREDVKHTGLAIQADVTIEERTMEARDQRANIEDLSHEVQHLIKQLDSDIVAALSRRKWSYDQIDSQCDELLARCQTCANTYQNQRSLTTPSSSGRITTATSLLLPVGIALMYWYYRYKKIKR